MLAESYDRSVHMVGDDFWHCIKRGWIAPYLNGSQDQNEIVIEALSAAATRFALGGYQVVIDAIIGPWLLDRFLTAPAQAALRVHYVVLRPREEVALRRAKERGPDALRDEGPVQKMFLAFEGLGAFERNVVESSTQTPQQTFVLIRASLDAGTFLLARSPT